MFLLLLVLLIFLLYYYSTSTYDYWYKLGVKYEKPVLPLFGNTLSVVRADDTDCTFLRKLHKKYPNDKYIGYFNARQPMLLIRDAEIIKKMISSNYKHFHQRGFLPHDDATEPLTNGLFTVDGDQWRLLRTKLAPAFTNSRMKLMFPLIAEKADELQRVAEQAAIESKEIDCKDLMMEYTAKLTSSCFIGIQAEDLTATTFKELGPQLCKLSFRQSTVTFLKYMSPKLFKNMHIFPSNVTNLFVNLVKKVMKQRDYKPIGRNDIIDTLLEMKQNGKMVGQSIEKRYPDGSPIMVQLELDDIMIAAQVFIFFLAGYETSANSSSNTLHQLAFHPDIQQKCQEEIDSVLSRYNNKLCYDAVKDMKYLEMVLRESMRLFPAAGCFYRICDERCTLPGTNVTLEKGTKISVSIHGLLIDEKYFKDPDKFDPDRFKPENFQEIKDAYMPFGTGSRVCIGENLGMIQALAGLASLLSKYRVEPSENTKRYPEIDTKVILIQSVKGGLPLRMCLRKKAV